jgi:hypothetical protein
MPQDAPLVVGWAQAAFVLPAAFGPRARASTGTLLNRLTQQANLSIPIGLHSTKTVFTQIRYPVYRTP